MRHTLALCALLVSVGGCGNDNKGSGGPDMSMPDLAPGPDMAVRMPDGVTCGAMTCPVGQSCCVTVSGMTTTSTCVAAAGSCGGATLACDGPEDCSGMQYCCGMITFTGGTNPDAGAPMFQGGNASCTASCDFNYTMGPPSRVTTRLCQADVDCTGLSAFGGSVMLNKCCSSQQAPGLHFCAAALGFGGITCP